MIPIITDNHFGVKSFSKPIFEMQMQFFEKQFFPYLLKNKIKDVLNGGDLVHNRNVIDLYILQELKTRFFKWFDDNGVRLHIIIGNHDVYFKDNINHNFLSENTREFKNVIVYDTPKVIQIEKYKIGMIPWIVSVDDNKIDLPEHVDIIFGHFDIVSFPMMKGVLASEGYSISQFKKYKMVLSGHYHIRSTQKNIHYIGTQFPLSWADFDFVKGFYVLDNNFKLEFIENTVSPKYLKIRYSELNGKMKLVLEGDGEIRKINSTEAIDIVKNNYVKLILENTEDTAMLEAFYALIQTNSRDDYKVEIVNVNDVIESFDFEEIEEKIREESDIFAIINSFISGMEFAADIKKETLIEYFKTLYEEADDLRNDARTQREIV